MRGGKPVSLLVRNLRYTTSPDRVRKFFEQFGDVRDVYLPLDYYSKLPRGFGFVEFTREEDAEAALDSLSRHALLDGNEVSVTIAQQGRKSPETMRHREKVVKPLSRNDYRSPDRRLRRRNRSYSYHENTADPRYKIKRGHHNVYRSRSSSLRQWYYSGYDKRYSRRRPSYDRVYRRQPSYEDRRYYSRQHPHLDSRYRRGISPEVSHRRRNSRPYDDVSRSSRRATDKIKPAIDEDKPILRSRSYTYEKSKPSETVVDDTLTSNNCLAETKSEEEEESMSATLDKTDHPSREEPGDDIGSAEAASDDNMSSRIATSTERLSPAEEAIEQPKFDAIKRQSQSPG